MGPHQRQARANAQGFMSDPWASFVSHFGPEVYGICSEHPMTLNLTRKPDLRLESGQNDDLGGDTLTA